MTLSLIFLNLLNDCLQLYLFHGIMDIWASISNNLVTKVEES